MLGVRRYRLGQFKPKSPLGHSANFCIFNNACSLFQFFVVLCLAAVGHAAPSAEADPQLLAAAGPYLAAAPASNCKVENEILTTQSCVPTAENVCTTEVVATEEIEYEKVCKDVVDILCDAPVAPIVAAGHLLHKREAEADAEAYWGGNYGDAHAAPLAPLAHIAPVAHAVAHSAVATVKHACREVTTQHCVDNPKVKSVPVEVQHCHVITKVTCTPVDNTIPKTICEPVETTHVASYALPYAGYGWGK